LRRIGQDFLAKHWLEMMATTRLKRVECVVRRLSLLLCLVLVAAFQNSPWAVAADDPGNTIGPLLDRFPSARGIDGKIAAWQEILSKPDELEAYLETLFDEGKDPLLAQDLGSVPAGKIVLLESRRSCGLRLFAEMSLRPYPELAALAALDSQQRRDAVSMIDRLEKVRPAVFRRALEHTDGGRLDEVLQQITMLGDMSLVEPMTPLLRIDDSRRSFYILSYLQRLAGQREVMRKVIDARPTNGSLVIALRYAIKAGDEEYATNAAIECVRRFADERQPLDLRFPPGDPRRADQSTNRAAQAVSVLARLNTPRAREAVMDLLEDENCPDHIQQALLTTFPDFLAEERMPLYEKVYGPDQRPYALSSYLRWLQRHESRAGVTLAKARLRHVLESWDSPETWGGISYLLWCGDQETIDFVSEAANGGDDSAFRDAVPLLIEAGLWDSLPGNIDARLVEASRGTEVQKQVFYCSLLSAVERHRTPRILPVLRFLTDNASLQRDQALLLMLELGDRSVIPQLKRMCSEKLAYDRIQVFSALFSAGETDYLDVLCSTAESSWLAPHARLAAVKGLSRAPDGQRKKAFSALSRLILSQDVYVSDEAFKALLEVSNADAVDFNPAADDDTRRRQCVKLFDWVTALQ